MRFEEPANKFQEEHRDLEIEEKTNENISKKKQLDEKLFFGSMQN